ncbi:hypothetical protein CRYUN_Cryun40dG0029500 [Craigia yunnanensis]
MAISRLLLRKPGGPHFHGRGLIQSINSCSSSSFSSGGSEKSSFLKGLKAPKEGKVVDKESKKESGTWFKGILTNIKQKMLGSPQIQKPIAGGTTYCKVDMKASDTATTENSPHDTKFLESQSVPQSPEVIMSSPGGIEGVSSCSTSNIVGENASEGPFLTATSDVCKMLNNPDTAGLGDIQSIVQPSEAVIVSHGNENDKLRTLASDTTVENSFLKINQLGNLSDAFVKKPKNKVKQFEEAMSDVLVDGDKEESPCAEDLFGLTAELISEKPKTFPDGTNDLSSSEIMNHLLGNRTATSIQLPNASTNSGKNRTSSKSSSRANDLVSIFKRKNIDPTTEEMAAKLHDTPAPAEFSKGKKVEKNLEIKDLIERLKGLPGEQSTIKARERTISNVTDQGSNGGFLKNVQSQANLQNSDVKRRRTLLKQHHMSSGNKMSLDKNEESSISTESICDRKEDNSLKIANSDHVKSGPNSDVPLPISREELNSSSQSCFSKEGSKENKVLVSFLTKNVQKHHILAAFSDCGSIVNVEEVFSTKGSIFKDFLVHFKTRKGYQIALKKNDLMVLNTEAFVEATSSEDMDDAISIPNLIGDPDAPVALVKNPTKTVKVKHLSEDISSQQLKKALAFCHSGISSLFLGSTSSVVYVEFETEDAKERALAEHSLLVSGKKLPILRIDAPRTTVVRISNLKPKSAVLKICNSYGQVKYVAKRAMGIVDVHFKLAEWPNMLNIVNSLNGIEVDENRWLAQPAPVFPLGVLRALWSRPEERQHVNAVICNLSRKLEKPISTTDLSQLTDLAAKYYGKKF